MAGSLKTKRNDVRLQPGDLILSNYVSIIQDNLKKASGRPPEDLARSVGAEDSSFPLTFPAFGEKCEITETSILLDGEPQEGPLGVVISLYAVNAKDLPVKTLPLKAFKEMDDSMPYAGAFVTHTESILIPKVDEIKNSAKEIAAKMGGGQAPEDLPGDFSMLVRPLPKIELCYIFYEADDDFPASATCLFSNNAGLFIPTDGLADVGEYTSRRILDLLAGS